MTNEFSYMSTEDRLDKEMEDAEKKAWYALARYKFSMFGYWASIWVHLNRIAGRKSPNPFGLLITTSREILSRKY